MKLLPWILGSILYLSLSSVADAITITEVEGKLECPKLNNTQECAIKHEKILLEQHRDLVKREPGLLHILLRNGTYYELKNERNQMNLLELSQSGRFLTIREQFHEGNTWHLLDLKQGILTETKGYPLFSPDGTAFVSSSQDLIANYSDNVLDVYTVLPNQIEKVFEAPIQDNLWGPEKVKWLNNNQVSFLKTQIDLNARTGISFLRQNAILERQAGQSQWTFRAIR